MNALFRVPLESIVFFPLEIVRLDVELAGAAHIPDELLANYVCDDVGKEDLFHGGGSSGGLACFGCLPLVSKT